MYVWQSANLQKAIGSCRFFSTENIFCPNHSWDNRWSFQYCLCQQRTEIESMKKTGKHKGMIHLSITMNCHISRSVVILYFIGNRILGITDRLPADKLKNSYTSNQTDIKVNQFLIGLIKVNQQITVACDAHALKLYVININTLNLSTILESSNLDWPELGKYSLSHSFIITQKSYDFFPNSGQSKLLDIRIVTCTSPTFSISPTCKWDNWLPDIVESNTSSPSNTETTKP